MHEGVRTGSVIHLACAVGGGAGSVVTAASQRRSHMFPQPSPARSHVTAPQRRRRT